jgi:dihydrofolate synthase/folylpolyglutamate synthase
LGVSTGSYTSPHLERLNERMAWNGEPIDDESLYEQLAQIALVEEYLPDTPSFFEIITGAAFSWFGDVAVEAAVVEVGLGGRWDATNVADGRVAVVTNVSIDHVEFLGATRASIADEKAGIVKPGAILVLGETDPELRPAFLDRGPAEVLVRDEHFGVRRNALAHGGRLIDLFTRRARYDDLYLSLHGAYQADNAAIALAAVEAFVDEALPHDLVFDVLGRVTSPGRLEVVGHQPLVLLDGAHNVAGAEALASALGEAFPSGARTLVVGFLREKDPREMLLALGAPDAARVVCCRPPSARGLDPEVDAEAAETLGVPPDRIEVVDQVAEAVDATLDAAAPDDQIVVTGSLYVVGAARAALRGRAEAASRVRRS